MRMCFFHDMKTKNKAKRKPGSQPLLRVDRAVSSDVLGEPIATVSANVNTAAGGQLPRLVDLTSAEGVACARSCSVDDEIAQTYDGGQLSLPATVGPAANDNPSLEDIVDSELECIHSQKWPRLSLNTSEVGRSTFCEAPIRNGIPRRESTWAYTAYPLRLRKAVLRGPVSLDFASGTIASERGQPSVSLLKEAAFQLLLAAIHSKANLTKRNFEAMSSTGHPEAAGTNVATRRSATRASKRQRLLPSGDVSSQLHSENVLPTCGQADTPLTAIQPMVRSSQVHEALLDTNGNDMAQPLQKRKRGMPTRGVPSTLQCHHPLSVAVNSNSPAGDTHIAGASLWCGVARMMLVRLMCSFR